MYTEAVKLTCHKCGKPVYFEITANVRDLDPDDGQVNISIRATCPICGELLADTSAWVDLLQINDY